VKNLTSIGAWLMLATALAGCSAGVDEEQTAEAELGTSREELKNWGGTKPGSCLDRCLSLCPKDSHGGIEAGCLLTCLGACSSPRAGVTANGAVMLAK
jgi:hypothetical protein